MADTKNQNQSNQQPSGDSGSAALEAQLQEVVAKNNQLVAELKKSAEEGKKAAEQNNQLVAELKSQSARMDLLEEQIGQVAKVAAKAGSQPFKKVVDILRVDRSKLTPVQLDLITTYAISWMGPRGEEYQQPVLVETIGTQNKAITHWRQAMNFSPEGLQGVKAQLVDNVPLEEKSDGKSDPGGAGQ